VLTTRARVTGSCQRCRVRARRVPDQSTQGMATIRDSRQSGTLAQPMKIIPVKDARQFWPMC